MVNSNKKPTVGEKTKNKKQAMTHRTCFLTRDDPKQPVLTLVKLYQCFNEKLMEN